MYIQDRKIASLGLRVRKYCSYHGLALNVNMDLEPFSRINPCGYQGLVMTDMQRESNLDNTQPVEMKIVADRLAGHLIAALAYQSP